MHLINTDGRIEIVRLLALFALRFFTRQAADQRSAVGAHLRFEGVRIGFDAQMAVRIE